MNYKEFAKKYLEIVGAFEPESNYAGALGDVVMRLVETHSAEGHSGMSAEIVNETFFDLNNAYQGTRGYAKNRSAIWDEFWASPEGQKLQEDVGTPGVMTPNHIDK